MSDNGVPAIISADLLFEKAPYVTVVLDASLTVIAANEAALLRLGAERLQVVGLPLFDLLPQPSDSGSGWNQRLRQSYAQVLASGMQVSFMLSPRDGLTADSGIAAAGSGNLWHVCHTPLHNEQGKVIAIATYALLLEGIEIATAKISGFSNSQMATPRTLPAVGRIGPSSVTGHETLPSSDAVIPVQVESAAGADGSPGARMASAAIMRILMVEDNDDLRVLNVKQLEMLGHQVTSTADAEQALRHLETSTFDLLFTDLTLPKMTGAELARIVLQQYHPMRVVITSGYGRAMANAQSLDALFLPKPYRFADLQEVLRQAKLRRDV